MRKRITIICGHYGSGKTELAVNLAILNQVNMLIDLDIVNPYFRSRELKEALEENAINTISSPLENSIGSDLPYLSSKIFLPFNDKSINAIFDVGGNDIGARVLRQFEKMIDPSEVDVLLVVNIYREETDSDSKIMKMIRSIEGSSGLKVTGLINNSNYLRNTTPENILKGEKEIAVVENQLGLQIVYTGIYELIDYKNYQFKGEVIPLKLYLRKSWL